MKRAVPAPAFLALAALGLLAASISPAPAQTAPALPAPSYASPIDALKTILRAQAGTDPAAIRDALVIAPDQKDIIDVLLAATAATNSLMNAAAKQFAADAEKSFGKSPEAAAAERIKTIDALPTKITGDTATIDIPEAPSTQPSAQTRPATQITFHKISAGWKVDAATYFHPSTTDIALAKKATDIAKETEKEVRDGKYLSAADASRAYWLRMSEAIHVVSPTTSPAPETVPAPVPMTMPATMPIK